ncbi:interleukin-15 isoform 3-T3 [Anomaloglossus baeobatrachus]|uniref:interleukin-15 isoform X3 n=1 Tax=Anomaloglossus baeobatrachus TaxID=238106 RepID=UPI003F4F4215
MNLWIVFLFSITLSFASYSVFTEGNNGKLLRKELDSLTTILKRSFYWENKYGTCTQSIFECFYKEFEVLLEEISLVEEEHVVNKVAKNFNQALQNMRSYNRLESKMPNTCKRCEEYEEKSIHEFLKSFESITQKMNVK